METVADQSTKRTKQRKSIWKSKILNLVFKVLSWWSQHTFNCSAVISGVSSYPPKVFGRPEMNGYITWHKSSFPTKWAMPQGKKLNE